MRAPNLTDRSIADIVAILDGWVGPLTWDGLIDEVERRLRRRYTRQALHKHARIADAFALRKKTLRDIRDPDARTEISPELQMALERIARLEAENLRLERENNHLLEQYARWIYNAHSRGLAINVLNQPLPSVDRDRTDRPQTGRKKARVV